MLLKLRESQLFLWISYSQRYFVQSFSQCFVFELF